MLRSSVQHRVGRLLAPILGATIFAVCCGATRAWSYDAELTWSPVAGAAGYRVYARQSGQELGAGIDAGAVQSTPEGTLRYTVSALSSGLTYFFAVAAYDGDGVQSALSNELSLAIAATPTMSATASPTLTATATSPPLSTSTATATRSATPTSSSTRTWTATNTPVPNTPTATRTATASRTSTATATRTPTPVDTATRTFTASPIATATRTATYTATPADTATRTASPTRTATPSATASYSATPTATALPDWRVSIPSDAHVMAGLSVGVPVNIEPGSGIRAFAISVDFDPSVVVVESVRLADAAGTGTVQTAGATSGRLTIVANLAQPLTAGGALVEIDYNAVGDCGSATALTIATCILDGGAIGCSSGDGALAVHCGVAGSIRHRSTMSPVAGATVDMIGSVLAASATTNEMGQFGFGEMNQGTWQLEPRKVGDIGASVSALDAALILQNITGWRQLDSVQRLVCDVTGNGEVTTLDATRILQYTVGQITRLPVAAPCDSDWAFIPEPADAMNRQLVLPQFSATGCRHGRIVLDPLAGDAPQEDFSAVPFGDCTGNWTAAAAASARVRIAGDARLRLGTPRQRDGQWVAPLYLASSATFSSVEARIALGDSTAVSVRAAGSANAAMLRFARDGAHLRMAMASAQPLRASGGPIAMVLIEADDARPSLRLLSGSVDESAARISD